jgi:hypothetical protein
VWRALNGLPHALDTTTHFVGGLIPFITQPLRRSTGSTAATAEKDSREDKNELIHGDANFSFGKPSFNLGLRAPGLMPI